MKFLFSTVFILLFIALCIYFLPNLITLIPNFGKTNVSLVSPLDSSKNIADNLWFPITAQADTQGSGAPDISADGVYFVDAETGRVLFQKNPHKRLPIASLTKIMTVIVSLENRNFDEVVKVSSHAASMEPDHMELIAGETLTVEELLDGIFLVSANDAAEALADTDSPGREKFIEDMNFKAHELGMTDSLFINPTGLEEDGKTQYSSAYDVALMSRYAIKKFPHLLDISREPHIFLDQTSTHQDYDLYSGINLLTTYPGVIGFKTGYTPEAGLTLVTIASRGGHTILGVLLNSEDRRGEARELLDYSFKKLGVSI